jgi:hypothetical protein
MELTQLFHALIGIDEASNEGAVSAFPLPPSKNLTFRTREVTAFFQPRCAPMSVYRLY